MPHSSHRFSAVLLSAAILVVLLLFALPVKMNPYCKQNGLCMPYNSLAPVMYVFKANFVSVNYTALGIEILLAFILGFSIHRHLMHKRE